MNQYTPAPLPCPGAPVATPAGEPGGVRDLTRPDLSGSGACPSIAVSRAASRSRENGRSDPLKGTVGGSPSPLPSTTP